jgi:cobalt-zinc-cadmium efflux system outer membrane protein
MLGKRPFSLCVLLLVPALAWPQQLTTPSGTVEDLVRTGIARNKDLLATRERIEEARGLAKQAGVRPAPLLSARGTTGRPLGTLGEENYSAEYSQPIETFGKRSKRIAVASFAVGQAEAELQGKSADLAYDIRTAYADREAEQRKLKVLADLDSVNADALRLTEARVKEGDVGSLEANLLRVEINRSLVLKAGAQSRLATAEFNLKKLAGLSASDPLPSVSSDTPAPESLNILQQRALEKRADLQGAELLAEQQAAAVDLAKANAKPDIDLIASYIRQYNQFDGLFGTTATGAIAPLQDKNDLLNFGVVIPLRTSRSGKGNVQAAGARSTGAQLRREYLERSIPLEVESAYRRWMTARSSLDLLGTGVLDLANSNLSVIKEGYKLGQFRLLDVLNEQRRLVDTQLTYIDAQADAVRGWAEVERAIGGNLP